MSILDQRKSGVLLHISSLPGKTGIGTLGEYAYKFVDYLKDNDQTYWQILPVGPTSYGDSPYQSFSTFAGNPYFIDLDTLVSEGYLKKSDYENVKWFENEHYAEFGILYVERAKVFHVLQKNFEKNIPEDYEAFCDDNAWWLNDYALFMSIKDEHDGASFLTWEDDIRTRKQTAIDSWSKKCVKRIEYYKMLQYFFHKQWKALKAYANNLGIKIIGDIPIYVSADSADVWASPEMFDLDENLVPREVAGCPPDGFSADGQLWGNPVYNWERQKQDGYTWWKKRLGNALKFYDVLRIDHFRGFDSYYCIPYGSPNAQNGQWRQGPGMDLMNAFAETFGPQPIIAEDLGFLTDSVKQLLKDSGFPGMKVLQFAFDSREESDYIPYKYPRHCVVYTGTHDNETILGWAKNADPSDVNSAKEYLRAETDDDLRKEMMIAALSSVANTCILTMQDIIGLGSEARMNAPSTLGYNWKWRTTEDQFTAENAAFLKKYTDLYGRRR